MVVGWQWHQSQQRGAGGGEPERVNARIADVRTMYRTTDVEQFAALVVQYKIEYVYVGPTERLYFPEAGLAKFSKLEGTLLKVFYENAEVTIYTVIAPTSVA